jgi:hypothetical protein
MRSHGISDFPDPNSSGLKVTAQAGSNSDLNPDDPAFQAASRTCGGSSLPGGSKTPASAKDVAAGVKLAECVRSHGFPSFPDPDSHDVFNVTGIDTSSPPLQSALNTCQAQTGVHRTRFSSRPGSS